jgi:hypothetical protein
MTTLRALVRSLLGIQQVVGRETAVAAAKEECLAHGWPWEEPIHVSEGLLEYRIMTNARMRGGNVNVRVRCRDGRVARSAFAAH